MDNNVPWKNHIVLPNSTLQLDQIETYTWGPLENDRGAREKLKKEKKELSKLQEVFYVDKRYSLLIIFQAMDAAGKDSTIEHVMSVVNPQGCRVYSFKHPTPVELRHHFLWRHQVVLPGKGMMAIFNRSHYENVLICKVHPSYVLNEEIPTVQQLEDITEEFWDERYRQIRDFERTLAESGTIILKFFLHVSPEEQKRRFIKRLQDPEKQWKFSFGDIEERKKWEDYQNAYHDALTATSTDFAPWFVIPADNKRYMRWAVCEIINQQLSNLDLRYPEISSDEKQRMRDMEIELTGKS